MSNINNSLVGILFSIALCLLTFAGACKAGPTPDEVFSIGEFHIGSTTLADVQSKLGSTHAYVHDQGLVRTICYYSPANQGVVVLYLNSSVLGGLQRLTGFFVKKERKQPGRCVQSPIDLQGIHIGMGVKLGESEHDFRAALSLQFKRRDAELFYEMEYRREMKNMEFASMKKQWQDIKKPSFFDVVEFVRATVRNGVIESYEVSRTESY
ncbi:hypothetical protein [Xanthomonas albilineans]|uniref:hypothetical protein n=1 Tax=Xanthomonas albilineans TaxID=29447 RepID=UPI000A8E288F|nr:hypothetical protein [Xanthomonas albilineans]